jgi:hypothetical protein
MKQDKRLPVDTAYPIVDLVARCNQKCLFCSNTPGCLPNMPGQLKKMLASGADTLRIGLWEPTLSDKLPELVSLARKIGFKKIQLRTNGVKLSDLKLTRSLLDAGVTTFHLNFPSHLPELSDHITQSKGAFERRLKGIENIIRLGGGKKICLLFVINSLNYHTMEQYAAFIAERFPGILHILFNMVCILGLVPKRLSLVPHYRQIEPHLAAAARVCERSGISFIVDDVPLCYMKGFEYASIDSLILREHQNIMLEKVKSRECSSCALTGECAGVRPQYLELYGTDELRPILSRHPRRARSDRN